jgi:predicted TIM-barrel enzyme
MPVLVGSGVTARTMPQLAMAHGFIVGSEAKHDGVWSNAVDPARANALVAACAQLPEPS